MYDELRGVAHRHLERDQRDHTLGTTGLVHEAYLKLVGAERAQWNDRSHFFAVASRAMRQILTDYARTRTRQKRGGGAIHVTLDGALVAADRRSESLIALDECLERLEQVNPRRCRVVECRFFAGMSNTETAEALGVSLNTVKRDWTLARGWLNQELADGVAP